MGHGGRVGTGNRSRERATQGGIPVMYRSGQSSDGSPLGRGAAHLGSSSERHRANANPASTQTEMTDDDRSNSDVDRLGDRLRLGAPSRADLDLLDDYRESFHLAYRKAVNMVRVATGNEPSRRPGKSPTSVVDKLKPGTMRLSQMQDIEGCRIVVDASESQHVTLRRLRRQLKPLGSVKTVDRR